MKSIPVELLVGPGISAEQLRDACLGTTLDALYKAGVTEIFHTIASPALKQFNSNRRFVHLDTSSMSLHGLYHSEAETHRIKPAFGRQSGNSDLNLPAIIRQTICTAVQQGDAHDSANALNPEKLSDQQLLEVYKTQGVSVERGFRSLKAGSRVILSPIRKESAYELSSSVSPAADHTGNLHGLSAS